ncbi:hypothetical protein sscle_11g083130 [Sclerotinia sclerotiorum 1980 UF-70]|uniref:Uncharacterized protein n=1 Tax=Sclerotinia sclerotiorum (strain ATCC 18683 / 1980 / Ss-1) TaxID=665079 RepID=A0A1D9QFZ4_SCLS1|nr:hypothetical protein sscle_11g083130 [Sclerotinia sclerotiorum 1980 UF-70]
MSTTTVSYPSPSLSSHETQDIDSLFTYAKLMHEHTRKQMEAADRSARRRSANADGTNAHATLRSGHESSTDSASPAGSR